MYNLKYILYHYCKRNIANHLIEAWFAITTWLSWIYVEAWLVGIHVISSYMQLKIDESGCKFCIDDLLMSRITTSLDWWIESQNKSAWMQAGCQPTITRTCASITSSLTCMRRFTFGNSELGCWSTLPIATFSFGFFLLFLLFNREEIEHADCLLNIYLDLEKG